MSSKRSKIFLSHFNLRDVKSSEISSRIKPEGGEVKDVTDETAFMLICLLFSITALVWIFIKYR